MILSSVTANIILATSSYFLLLRTATFCYFGLLLSGTTDFRLLRYNVCSYYYVGFKYTSFCSDYDCNFSVNYETDRYCCFWLYGFYAYGAYFELVSSTTVTLNSSPAHFEITF